MGLVLRMLDALNERGVDVTAEQYPCVRYRPVFEESFG